MSKYFPHGQPHGEYDGPDEDWTYTEEEVREAINAGFDPENLVMPEIFGGVIVRDGEIIDLALHDEDKV